jgi:hypothetical protein
MDLAASVDLSETPYPPRFLFGVLKLFCRFRIWSNTYTVYNYCRCSPQNLIQPLPVTHYINTYPCTYSHRDGGWGL